MSVKVVVGLKKCIVLVEPSDKASCRQVRNVSAQRARKIAQKSRELRNGNLQAEVKTRTAECLNSSAWRPGDDDIDPFRWLGIFLVTKIALTLNP